MSLYSSLCNYLKLLASGQNGPDDLRDYLQTIRGFYLNKICFVFILISVTSLLVQVHTRTLMYGSYKHTYTHDSIYRTFYFFLLFMCRCLTFSGGDRVAVFETWTLRGIFGPKKQETTKGWINCMMRSSIICDLYRILHN